jgi:signal transduction histidine kinase
VPPFTADENQLEQVLLNLVLNAQNARARTIEVSIGYDAPECVVRLEVSDDGVGMNEEVRKRIFQPFFTTRTTGTGLGLATCLKNVEYHGGTIEVTSQPGEGTRFSISIPLVCRL